MMSRRIYKRLAFLVLISIVQALACTDPGSIERVHVSLDQAAIYQYPTVGGDEEGARILIQAKQYRISEIRRSSETNWIATYTYQPADGFVGSVYVEIEILTGSDGASAPTASKRVAFYFDIRP